MLAWRIIDTLNKAIIEYYKEENDEKRTTHPRITDK